MADHTHHGTTRMTRIAALILALTGCTPIAGTGHDRVGCSAPATSSGSGSGSAAPASSSSGDPTPDIPSDCDVTVGGRVLVVGLDSSTGTGPTVVYLHGTYESPDGVLATDSAAQAIASAVTAAGGVMLLPRGRDWWLPGGPWPWGAVTGDAAWMAADEAVVAQALACTPGDPGRVSVAGFSAGAIAAAYLGELRPWASIVLWSGGVLPEDRPAHPDSPAVLTIHGGAADPYQTLVEGAIDYAAQAPSLGVVCDHGGGHSTGLGSDGAAFLAAADVGAPHPWASGLPTWTAQHYCEVTP